MAERLAHLTNSQGIMSFSPAQASWFSKAIPIWARGDDNGVSIHPASRKYSRKYLAIDRDGNCT